MSERDCVNCGSVMRQYLADWHHVCDKCRYEKACLNVSIDSLSAHGRIDEQARVSGLRELRIEAYRRVLTVLRLNIKCKTVQSEQFGP